MTQTDVGWAIHTKDRGTIAAENAITDIERLNQLTRGETAEFEFRFVGSGANATLVVSAVDLTVENGETYTVESGTTETYTHITVKDGGDLVINGTLETVDTIVSKTIKTGTTEIYSTVNCVEYGRLNVEENGTINATGGDNADEFRVYERDAGNFASIESINNTQNFRQFLSGNADVSSLVIGLEPSQSLQDRGIKGVWGLLTDASDTRNRALTNDTYRVTVRVLDDFAAYSSVTDVENDLEV